MPRSKKLTLKKNKTSKSITKKSRSSRKSRKTLKGGVNPNHNEVFNIETKLGNTEELKQFPLLMKKLIVLMKKIKKISEKNNTNDDTLKYKKELSATLRLLKEKSEQAIKYINKSIGTLNKYNNRKYSKEQYLILKPQLENYINILSTLDDLILNEGTPIKPITEYYQKILKTTNLITKLSDNYKDELVLSAAAAEQNNSGISSATASPVSGSNNNLIDFVMV